MTVKQYYAYLKREFDRVVGSFVNGRIGRPAVEGYIITTLVTNPIVVKNFRFNRSKNAIPIVYDALEAAMRFGRVVRDEQLIQLLKSVSDNWEYLFSTDDLPTATETSKQWNEMFDACYFFVDLAMKNGWYCISDNSKLFLVAKSLEEKEHKNDQEDKSATQKPQEKPAAKPSGPVTVQVRQRDAVKKTPTKDKAEPPKACSKIHVAAKPAKPAEQKLKTYNVAVMRTSYGVIPIQAENEDEAVDIATGVKPMRDGTWASEVFKPTEHDCHLELNDGLDDCVSEVVE